MDEMNGNNPKTRKNVEKNELNKSKKEKCRPDCPR